MHDTLGPAVPRGRIEERLQDHVGALGVDRDAVADDKAREVVDQDQREDGRAVDVSMNEVEMHR